MNAAGQAIVRLCLRAGASHAGVVPAEAVSDADWQCLESWRTAGRHADMAYMERYDDVRRNPRLLLAPDGPEARSLVVCLFNYNHGNAPMAGPRVAEYARGLDYHIVLRQRLQTVCQAIAGMGGTARVCVDSAPLRERYWAQRAGLGHVGRNGQLTVPGEGAGFVIATVVTDLDLGGASHPAVDVDTFCGSCRRCVDACPAHALDGTGSVDARRCLSYLTIESKEDVPADTPLCGQIFGCDICRRVCPHAANAPVSQIEEFAPRQALMALTTADWQAMTAGDFRRLSRGTPLQRTRLAHIKATLVALMNYKL